MRVKRTDLFARIPERIALKLRRGELTFDEHAVLVLLVQDADYRTSEVAHTLRAFADDWSWTKSPKQLGRVFYSLRDKHGEIAFEVDERQRGPWVIRIVGDGFGMDCDVGAPSDVAVIETRAGSESRAIPDAEPASAVPQLRQARPSDVDTDSYQDQSEDLRSSSCADALRAPSRESLSHEEEDAAFRAVGLLHLVSALRRDERAFRELDEMFPDLTAQDFEDVRLALEERHVAQVLDGVSDVDFALTRLRDRQVASQ